MWYRIGAVRNLSGGRKTQLRLTRKLKEVHMLFIYKTDIDKMIIL